MYDDIRVNVGADEAAVKVRVKNQTERISVNMSQGGGISDAARRLLTPREISLTGSAQGGAYFDGTEDIGIYTALETLTNAELEEMLK